MNATWSSWPLPWWPCIFSTVKKSNTTRVEIQDRSTSPCVLGNTGHSSIVCTPEKVNKVNAFCWIRSHIMFFLNCHVSTCLFGSMCYSTSISEQCVRLVECKKLWLLLWWAIFWEAAWVKDWKRTCKWGEVRCGNQPSRGWWMINWSSSATHLACSILPCCYMTSILGNFAGFTLSQRWDCSEDESL